MERVKLSIVIVNYNVRFFLEQCLHSVRKACQKLSCEIFVVDNNSQDFSCQMVKTKFLEVILIENKSNVGFSAANNQAIRVAKGEYILLLNPDTIVQEDTFHKTIEFMDQHPDAGGLGVKMIDGNGKFLPESKRGLPTPLTAFFKIFGLSKLFPKSKLFGKYHLTYLDRDSIHEVDVLSGAFMLLRKDVLDKIGLLDENFFMYGEDIDLSYRVQQAGYKNYYFPHTTIVHYKGESTKKQSLNYVRVFYNAMEIFYKKHFHGKFSTLLTPAIKVAIYLRAFLAIANRIVRKVWIPLTDAILMWGFFWIVLPFWEVFKFGQNGVYPDTYLQIVVPIYIFIIFVAVLFSGGYDHPYRHKRFIRGVFIGFGSILLFYSLLSEELRFSRAMILFSMMFASTFLPLLRYVYGVFGIDNYAGLLPYDTRVLIAGNEDEEKQTLEILRDEYPNSIIGRVNNNAEDTKKLGSLEDLPDVVRIWNIDEIIFCSTSIPISEIINAMMHSELEGVKFKIATPDNVSIIGSSYIISGDPLFNVEINSISKPINKRLKRTFDVVVAGGIVLFFPFIFWTINNSLRAVKNSVQILLGKKSWIGYHQSESATLPKIKPGVLSPVPLGRVQINQSTIDKINFLYAKDYKVINDLAILLRNWKHLGK